ncbi:MAG: hypothetical protein V4674_03115 [Patescibacteria group bacterium]
MDTLGEKLPKTDDPAYSGKLVTALVVALARALGAFCSGKVASCFSILMSGFGTASSTAATRATGVGKVLFLPLRVLFGGLGALALGAQCLLCPKRDLTADQCDVAAAFFLRIGRAEDAIAYAQEGLEREGSRPNSRALLSLRMLEGRAKLIAGSTPSEFSANSEQLNAEYEELERALDDFDPENRSRFHRSYADFLACRDNRTAAGIARQRAIELAMPWPDQLAKARAIRFYWE